MRRKLTIALVAHDHRKADMVEWVIFNSDFLSVHHLVCTGTTGGLVQEALQGEGVNPEITRMNSGPMGGDAEIAAMLGAGADVQAIVTEAVGRGARDNVSAIGVDCHA